MFLQPPELREYGAGILFQGGQASVWVDTVRSANCQGSGPLDSDSFPGLHPDHVAPLRKHDPERGGTLNPAHSIPRSQAEPPAEPNSKRTGISAPARLFAQPCKVQVMSFWFTADRTPL